MPKYTLLFVVLVCCLSTKAQIWTNPLSSTNLITANPYTAGQTADPNITVSGIGRGSGINADGIASAERYNAKGWTSGSTLNTGDFFYFTLTPSTGYQINFSTLVFTCERSGSGPDNFVVRSSLDNYANNIGSVGSIPANAATRTVNLSSFQNITTPITFRIYGYNADNGNGTFSINDFSFNGATALPVSFGHVQAQFKAGQLSVMWSTLSEKNNDYFDIELSSDGEIFRKIGSVKTAAPNGDSATTLTYNFALTGDAITVSALCFLLLSASAGLFQRRKGYAIAVSAVLIGFISCNKADNGLKAEKEPAYFVRVAQVDIDAKKTYSKVVRVTPD